MKKNKFLKIGNSLIISGGLLLIFSSAFLFHNVCDDYNGQLFSENIVKILPNGKMSGDNVPRNEAPLYETIPDVEMPSVEIDGYSYIGKINIPALDLLLPVMNEWNYSNLKLAPCRFQGSVYQKNLVVVAHNYKSHFGNLKYLKEGDQIDFTDIDGNVFEYKVGEIEQVFPTDAERIVSKNGTLTLVTCTIDGNQRTVVYCIPRN